MSLDGNKELMLLWQWQLCSFCETSETNWKALSLLKTPIFHTQEPKLALRSVQDEEPQQTQCWSFHHGEIHSDEPLSDT